ncbi:unnamed protein product [Orchesella dallaii]|uniref:Actin maturation protease n=1 Tax=Orchesella dallaii TaxID=48710 RepID=A0ABP1S6T1_9HEXA
MSSIPAPPPPPAPPPAPVLPAEVNSSSSPRLKSSRTYPLLLQLEQNGTQSEAESVCPLGYTETKDVTVEEFIEEISKLVSFRLEDFSLTSIQDGDCKDTILMVVMPLTKPILQNGPMCGIVALAEALQIMKKNVYVDPKVILDEAIKRGYSKQGEMFSVVAMQTLAEVFGGCQQSSVIDSEVKSTECVQKLVTNILMGFPALIPYDADYNHSPSQRKGHAAHWAVIHGLATCISSSNLNLVTKNSGFEILLSSPELTIVQPIQQNQDKNITELFKTSSLHVIAHQGKSYRIGLWKYNDLVESNQNLKEMAPKLLNNPSEFVFGDIVHGLCSKVLLLK